MSNTEDRLVQLLSYYCGERGDSEGAVETLERIIDERHYKTTKIVVLEAELLLLREVAEAAVVLVAQCESMGRASHTTAVIGRVHAALTAWGAAGIVAAINPYKSRLEAAEEMAKALDLVELALQSRGPMAWFPIEVRLAGQAALSAWKASKEGRKP